MDEKELRITADLARLKISDQELTQYAQAFSKLLDYFSVMDDFLAKNASQAEECGVPPASTAQLRKDVADNASAPKLVANAGEHEDDYILLPNVL